MSPMTVTAAICEALDAEREKNPGADLLRAREVVIQTMERLAWDAMVTSRRVSVDGVRMDGEDMQRAEEQPYEVRHG